MKTLMENRGLPDALRHQGDVSRELREQKSGQRGRVIWFTGLSGAGKSTLANAVEAALHRGGFKTFLLDGDTLRQGLCNNLGFSRQDRSENVRRIAEVNRLFVDAGLITLTACISPMREDRERARQIIGAENFFEIWVNCPLAICEERDVKGMYKKARAGEIMEFTGISSPYEHPLNAALVLQTDRLSIEECVTEVIQQLRLE